MIARAFRNISTKKKNEPAFPLPGAQYYRKEADATHPMRDWPAGLTQ